MKRTAITLSCIFALLIVAFLTASGSAETYIVNNTNDEGTGSLRQALINANTHVGADTIVFNISISDTNYNALLGVWTIKPDTALPDLTDDGTLIDGFSQALFIESDTNLNGPEIEINGSNAGLSNGFFIESAYNSIRGLVINEFERFGIEIFKTNAHNNTISGNYIGTDVTGTIDMGNFFSGIIMYDGTQNNIIGGSTAEERNIISGNDWSGVEIQAWDADYNVVIGNYIGTDVTGTHDLGNTTNGVYIWSGAANNQVGGLIPNERNIISGNGWDGVSIGGAGTDYNTVTGNFIGTDVNGAYAIQNGRNGVIIGGEYNTIGGAVPEAGNVISGNNMHGIELGGSNNTFSRNKIGTDASGELAIPNDRCGIIAYNGAQSNLFGTNNTIKYNGEDGIQVNGASTITNRITQNSISENTGLGINNIDGGNLELIPPTIDSFHVASVFGTTYPNSTVEIFSDTLDEGLTYEGTTLSDGGGKFSFTKLGGFAGPYLTATVTDAAGNTSEFSEEFRIANARPILVTPIENVTLNEDFGAYTAVENMDTLFYDPPPSTPLTFGGRSLHDLVAVFPYLDNLALESYPNIFGIDSVIVTATDLQGLSVSDTFTVTINPVNDTPFFLNQQDTVHFVNGTSVDVSIWEIAEDVETADSLLDYIFDATNDSILANYDETSGWLNISAVEGFAGTGDLFITVTDDSGATAQNSFFVIVEAATAVSNRTGTIPAKFQLCQNYPNPFNPETVIQYQIPKSCYVTISIYNTLGQRIRTLVDELTQPGVHKVIWDGRDEQGRKSAGGIYLYKLETEAYVDIKKLLLLR